jgi:hypothetical protein
MLRINLISCDVIDRYGPTAMANVTANRRLNDEFIASLNAKINIVADLASDPPIFGDTRNDRETHARRFARGIKRGTHSRYLLNQANVKFDRTWNFHRELYPEFRPHPRFIPIRGRLGNAD